MGLTRTDFSEVSAQSLSAKPCIMNKKGVSKTLFIFNIIKIVLI